MTDFITRSIIDQSQLSKLDASIARLQEEAEYLKARLKSTEEQLQEYASDKKNRMAYSYKISLIVTCSEIARTDGRYPGLVDEIIFVASVKEARARAIEIEGNQGRRAICLKGTPL